MHAKIEDSMHPGRFITFEGMDGCGKTTQFRLLRALAARPGKERGRNGGTGRNSHRPADPQDPARSRERRYAPRAELLLYFASRAQNVDQVIRPALDTGRSCFATVLPIRRLSIRDAAGSRYGCGARSGPHRLPRTETGYDAADRYRSGNQPRARQRRNERAGATESRIDEESPAFHERVRQGYLALAKAEPDRIRRDRRPRAGRRCRATDPGELEHLRKRVFENFRGNLHARPRSKA